MPKTDDLLFSLHFFLPELRLRLAADAERWLLNSTFGLQEPQLQAAEDAYQESFGPFVPLSQATNNALQHELLDMQAEGWGWTS